MKITFIPSSKEVEDFVSPPELYVKNLPEWYRKEKKISPKKLFIGDNNKPTNLSVKHCLPFFDAISSGYVQKTWTDIYIKNNNGTVDFYWSSDPKIIGFRDKVSINIDKDYYPIEFLWFEPWVPKTPKGYSVLYTHPLNSLDLPFTSLSAIVDSDSHHHTFFGQYPFFIKNNFEGLIPKGTPMYQIIPFKRNSWNINLEKFDEHKNNNRKNIINSRFLDSYRENFWTPKQYK